MRISYLAGLVFLAAVALMAAISIGYFYSSLDSFVFDSANERLVSTTSDKAAQIEYFLSRNESLAASVARNMQDDLVFLEEEGRENIEQAGKVSREFSRIITYRESVLAISFIGAGGDVIASTSKEKLREEIEKASNAIEQDSGYTNKAYVSAEFGVLAVDYAVPVYNEERQIIGSLVLTQDITKINSITSNRSALGSTGESYLTTSQGYMITPSIFLREAPLTRKIDTAAYRACAGSESGRISGEELGRYEDYVRHRVIGAYSKIDGVEWCLISEINESEVYASAQKLIQQAALFIIGLTLFFAILIILVIRRLVSKPLEDVSKKVEKITKGDFNITLGRSPVSEINSLNKSLSRILSSLKLAVLKAGVAKEDIALGEALEAKRAAEEKYEGIFKNASDAIFIADAETRRIVDCNEAAQEITGRSREEILMKTAEQLIPKEKVNETKRAFEKPVNSEAELIESELLTAEGKKIPVSIKTKPFTIGGRPHLIGVFRDISQQKKEEFELKESESRLKALFEYAPAGIYVMDFQGKFIDGNKRAEELVGYSRNELLGKDFFSTKILNKSDIPKGIALLAKNKEGKSTGPDEFMLKKKDGTRLPVEIRTYPVKLRGKKVVMGIVQDITYRNKMVNAVKESAMRFKKLFDFAPTGIFLSDLKGTLLETNEASEKITGYSKEELKGKNFLTSGLIAKKYLPLIMKSIANLKLGKHDKPIQVSFNKKDGSKSHVEISAEIVEINGKERLLGIVNDLTEFVNVKKELETERKQSQNILDISGAIIAGLDKEGNIILLNKRGRELLEVSEKDAVGKNWFDNFIPERVRGEVREAHSKNVRGKKIEVAYYENPVLSASGKEYLIAWQNAPYIDESGQIIGTLSSGVDITKRRKARDERDAVKRRFEIAFDEAQIMMSLSTVEEGRFIDINKAAIESTGYSKDEFIGKTSKELNIFVDPGIRKKIKETALRGEKIKNWELQARKKNGEVIDVLFSTEAITGANGEKLLLSTIEDITNLKKILEKLKVSEEEFRGIFENSPEAIIEINPKGVITKMNKRVQDWLKYTPEEVVGKSITQLPILDAKNKAVALSVFAKRLAGAEIAPYKLEFRNKAGENVAGIVNGILIRDKKGKIKNVLVMITNIEKGLNKLPEKN